MNILIVLNDEHQLVHVSAHHSLEGARERAKGIDKPVPFTLADNWRTLDQEVLIIDAEVEK
jgi:hypothetical protein